MPRLKRTNGVDTAHTKSAGADLAAHPDVQQEDFKPFCLF